MTITDSSSITINDNVTVERLTKRVKLMNISEGSQNTNVTTMEGRQDNQCNINIPGKKIINTNHNNVVETDQAYTGQTLSSSMETAQAKLEELVESKVEAVAREADIIPVGRKEKARS